MSRPTAHGLACASYGSEPSVLPPNADGEQLPHEVSIRARLFFATQSAAGRESIRAAHSQKPLPGTQVLPKKYAMSASLHPVSKLVGPTTLYLLDPISSMTPCSVTTPAIRLCTPQSWELTPPVPKFAATSIDARAPIECPIRMMFFAGAGKRRFTSWASR